MRSDLPLSAVERYLQIRFTELPVENEVRYWIFLWPTALRGLRRCELETLTFADSPAYPWALRTWIEKLSNTVSRPATASESYRHPG